jgi:hypothetical protein
VKLRVAQHQMQSLHPSLLSHLTGQTPPLTLLSPPSPPSPTAGRQTVGRGSVEPPPPPPPSPS